jgi:predicted Fe-Mo cluster-binding NifX family protein
VEINTEETMRIVVTADGAGIDAPASPVFGRCQNYVFVDTETLQWEAVENPARGAPGGAGIQAAQFVIERGAQAVVTGQIGPNAMGVFQAAGVPAYLFAGGTVREAVTAFQAGLPPAQAGGRGRGKGGGGGRLAAAPAPATSTTPSTAGREEILASLKETVDALRRQLAEVTEQIDRLQKE